MTSVPYPAFVLSSPAAGALSAVGKCRVYPEPSIGSTSMTDAEREYRAIVEKAVEQSKVTCSSGDKAKDKESKQLRKQYMKEGNAMASRYLSNTLGLDPSIVDIEIVISSADVLQSDGCVAACFLDAGCHAIVLPDGTDGTALDACQLPRDRVVAHFNDTYTKNTESLLQLLLAAAPLASTMSLAFPVGTNMEDTLSTLNSGLSSSDKVALVVQVPAHTEGLEQVVGRMSKMGTTMCIVDPTAQELGMSYVACIRTDRPDGLYTTVVCTRSNEALGLVYSSKESVVAALECGRGVYYSRSRNGLWRKGDTSGHYQTLHRIDVDCDGDALRFTVTQRGDDVAAFCHLNTLTCWGEPRGIRHLEGTLKQRLKDAPEGSYTKRLFDDEQLLRDKLVEEAQELSEAADPQEVAGELADVLYFAMVRAAKAGVSIDDAVVELDKRARKVTRRQGDSKSFRIAAGEAILNKTNTES